MSDRRCGTLALFVVVLIVGGGATPLAAAADAGGSEWTTAVDDGGTTAVDPGVANAVDAGWATAVDAGSTAAPQSENRTTIRQRTVASRNDEPGSVTLTFRYDVPPSVTDLRASVPVASLSGVSLGETEGFEREGATRFRWDGETDSPAFSLRMAVGESLSDGVRGVERDDWALVSEPNSRVQVQGAEQPARTQSFEVADGEPGYASSHLAYLGDHDRRNVTVADEEATFVLGSADTETERATAFLRTANEHFDLGVQRESVTVFVLPLSEAETEDVEAATVETAFWVSSSGIRLDETGSVFAHEYVHTRLGTTGRNDATWLTEATAEYYGRVFALNDGVGSYASFREGLRATEYAPDRRAVVLDDPQTWTGTTAHYTKGAHVLAALDAEIQRRSDGERSLRDVFEGRSEPFENYDAFRAAVIEVSGDDSLGEWLDRYVTTEDLPPLPEHPRYYVAEPSLDPDGDGMESGAELDEGRHPFVEGEGPEMVTAGGDAGEGEATPAAGGSDGETRTGDDGAETDDTAATGGTDGDAPGFGIVAAVAGIGAFLVGVRRR